MLFYNPIIRYTLLNTLKFNMTALMALTGLQGTTKDTIFTSVFFSTLIILPFFYAGLLYKNRA
jgi:hypothetical protein